MDLTALTAGFNQVKHGPGGFLAEGTIWTKPWKRVTWPDWTDYVYLLWRGSVNAKQGTRRLPVFWRIFCYTGRKNQSGGPKTRVLVPEERSQESQCSLKGFRHERVVLEESHAFSRRAAHSWLQGHPGPMVLPLLELLPLPWCDEKTATLRCCSDVLQRNQLTHTQSLGI